jgi:transcriptional regulator with PAS, ATPase and Fis domain
MVEAGSFREDLFYRINVFRLTLPPLRLRKETIPGLAKIFIRRNNIALDKHVNDITKEAQVLLANYEYPGNVRELENIIEHAVALAPDNKIRIEDLPEVLFRQQPRLTAPTGETSAPEDYSISAMEKKHIEHVLQLLNHNYSEAAKELGVSRSTLWRKMKEYGIKRKRES